MIKKQEEQVDKIFDNYLNEMNEDLDNFIDFMRFYEQKKAAGEEV